MADENPKTTLLLIDNFRYDQWRSISSLLRGYYDVAQDDFYCAILPTATQYARNAIFAGLMPLAIDKLMPNKWLNDNEEGGKNQYEEEFLKRLMAQNGKTGNSRSTSSCAPNRAAGWSTIYKKCTTPISR